MNKELNIKDIEQILHNRIKNDEFTALKSIPTPDTFRSVYLTWQINLYVVKCIYKRIQGSTMKKAINIRLDESLLSDLDSYAKELDRTRTYIIEKAVGTYFDTLDEMISDKRIDEVKKGNVEVFSLEQVSQQLGLN